MRRWSRRRDRRDCPLTVLAWPADLGPDDNPLPREMSTALEATGVRVRDFSIRACLTERFDVLHIHWPDAQLKDRSTASAAARLAVLVGVLGVTRLRGAKIVWTVHNLAPHGQYSAPLAAILYWSLAQLVTVQVHLSPATHSEMVHTGHRCRDGARVVIPHGLPSFGGATPPASDRTRAGQHFTFGFVGRVERYKGLDRLVAGFQALDDEDAHLRVHGRCADEVLPTELLRLIAGHDRITWRDEWLSDYDFAEAVRAADLVVLPYREVLNSGVAYACLACGTRCLLPRSESSQWLQSIAGDGRIALYDGELTAAVLSTAAEHRGDGYGDLSELAWSSVAGRSPTPTGRFHRVRHLGDGSAQRLGRSSQQSKILPERREDQRFDRDGGEQHGESDEDLHRAR